MKSTLYFSTLFKKKHIPILIITAALLFFSLPLWFWLPFFTIRGPEIWSSLFLIGIVTATLVTLILLPLQFTVVSKQEYEKSVRRRIISRFSLRFFLGFSTVYFILLVSYSLSNG